MPGIWVGSECRSTGGGPAACGTDSDTERADESTSPSSSSVVGMLATRLAAARLSIDVLEVSCTSLATAGCASDSFSCAATAVVVLVVADCTVDSAVSVGARRKGRIRRLLEAVPIC